MERINYSDEDKRQINYLQARRLIERFPELEYPTIALSKNERSYLFSFYPADQEALSEALRRAKDILKQAWLTSGIMQIEFAIGDRIVASCSLSPKEATMPISLTAPLENDQALKAPLPTHRVSKESSLLSLEAMAKLVDKDQEWLIEQLETISQIEGAEYFRINGKALVSKRIGASIMVEVIEPMLNDRLSYNPDSEEMPMGGHNESLYSEAGYAPSPGLPTQLKKRKLKIGKRYVDTLQALFDALGIEDSPEVQNQVIEEICKESDFAEQHYLQPIREASGQRGDWYIPKFVASCQRQMAIRQAKR